MVEAPLKYSWTNFWSFNCIFWTCWSIQTLTWNVFAVNFSFSVLSNAVKSANLDIPSLLTLGYYKRSLCFSGMGNGQAIRRKKDLS